MTAGVLKPAGPNTAPAVRRRFGNPPDYPLDLPKPLPRLAVVFLHPANQRQFEFANGGESRVAGLTAWKVDFKEKAPLVPGTSVRGSFSIDPAVGRVLKSEVFRATSPLFAEITATYAADRATGLFLPAQVKERSAATEVMRVDTASRITNCRVMPVESR